jgi:Uma2 family endonuclease
MRPPDRVRLVTPEPPESTEGHRSAPLTYAEYLAIEEASDERHELIDGRLVPVAGPSIIHARLVKNLIVLLTKQLGDRCEALPGARVYVPLTGNALYPDLLVFCGEEKRHEHDKNALTNPKVVVEVLSPTTARFDRTEKFELYKSIPSLKEYVLLSQREAAITVFRRGKGADWSPHYAGASATIDLTSIQCVLVVDEVYAKGNSASSNW